MGEWSADLQEVLDPVLRRQHLPDPWELPVVEHPQSVGAVPVREGEGFVER